MGGNGDSLPPTSGFVAACPKLTELTVIYPHPDHSQTMGTGRLLDRAGGARSAISELVIACKALPDFDTLQIVYSPGFSMGWQEQALREEVDGIKDWTMECLRKSETGCRDGEGGTITLKVIDLSSERPRPRDPLDFVGDGILTTPGTCGGFI